VSLFLFQLQFCWSWPLHSSGAVSFSQDLCIAGPPLQLSFYPDMNFTNK
jgi:hypothetical protein